LISKAPKFVIPRKIKQQVSLKAIFGVYRFILVMVVTVESSKVIFDGEILKESTKLYILSHWMMSSCKHKLT